MSYGMITPHPHKLTMPINIAYLANHSQKSLAITTFAY